MSIATEHHVMAKRTVSDRSFSAYRIWTVSVLAVGLLVGIVAAALFWIASSRESAAERVYVDAWAKVYEIADRHGVSRATITETPRRPVIEDQDAFWFRSQPTIGLSTDSNEAERRASREAAHKRALDRYEEEQRLFGDARHNFQIEKAASSRLRADARRTFARAKLIAIIASGVVAAGLVPLLYVNVVRPTLVLCFRTSRAVRDVAKAEIDSIDAKSRE